MTIEQLLECSVEKLEAMSDKELTEYLSPYFNVTRPEMQIKNSSLQKVSRQADIELKLKMQRAMAIAKSFGIDLGK